MSKLFLLAIVVLFSFELHYSDADFAESAVEMTKSLATLTNPIGFATGLVNVAIKGFELYAHIHTMNMVNQIDRKMDEVIKTVDVMDKKLDQIQNQLIVVSQQLTVLEAGISKIVTKVDEIIDKIHDTAVIEEFDDKQEQIRNLEKFFHRYAAKPNEHTRNDLRRECEENNMIKFAQYVQKEATVEDKLALRNMMFRNDDLKKFNSWSRILGERLVASMILHGVCLSVRITDNSTLESVIDYDYSDFLNVTKELANFIKKGNKQITDKYNEMAEMEVNEYAKLHTNENNLKFAQELMDILNKKIYWRYWYVGVCVSYSCDSGVKSFRSNNSLLLYIGKKRIVISSTNNPIDLQDYLINCMERYKENQELFDYIVKCFGEVNALIGVNYEKGVEDLGNHSHVAINWSVEDSRMISWSNIFRTNSTRLIVIAP